MYNTNINLNLYKTFLVVAKSKSLSDASNKLNIEKPSLSRSIKQLEDTLGVKLFYRDNKGELYIDDPNQMHLIDPQIVKNLREEKGEVGNVR